MIPSRVSSPPCTVEAFFFLVGLGIGGVAYGENRSDWPLAETTEPIRKANNQLKQHRLFHRPLAGINISCCGEDTPTSFRITSVCSQGGYLPL